MFAIIGGSGLSSFEELAVERRELVHTPYGETSATVTFGQLAGQPVAFLPRHGHGHTVPPHDINYRANVWALQRIGVEGIVAVASVGGIGDRFRPGEMVLPDQIIDYTSGRRATYFDAQEKAVTHIDFTNPFDATLRARIHDAARRVAFDVIDGGCYACTQGPRLETAAEIRRIDRDGGDVVGMTLMPEAALSRELELPYAALLVVVNWAAGRDSGTSTITSESIASTLSFSVARVRSVVMAFVSGTRSAPR